MELLPVDRMQAACINAIYYNSIAGTVVSFFRRLVAAFLFAPYLLVAVGGQGLHSCSCREKHSHAYPAHCLADADTCHSFQHGGVPEQRASSELITSRHSPDNECESSHDHLSHGGESGHEHDPAGTLCTAEEEESNVAGVQVSDSPDHGISEGFGDHACLACQVLALGQLPASSHEHVSDLAVCAGQSLSLPPVYLLTARRPYASRAPPLV